jgi:hypothetical protein
MRSQRPGHPAVVVVATVVPVVLRLLRLHLMWNQNDDLSDLRGRGQH